MFRAVSLVGILSLASVTVAAAQPPEPTTHTSFPRVIRIAGTLPKPVGAPSPTETITFAIYAEETGGTPLWQETQTVTVDRTGAYTALLGSTVPDGLPLEIFTTYDARWLSIHLEGANEPDQPRVLIASVAYALRAADADTLGGKPASAYVLADPPIGAPHTSDRTTSSSTAGTNTSTPKAGTNASSSATTMGTPGHLGLFLDPTDLGDSIVVQSGPRIGIGTAGPADYLHVAFNDPYGAFTGLAVQNFSSSANAASGMLFFDQNGALGQFQGFNNTNHAYVINNIAKNGSSQFDGSINFLIGSTSKLFVATNGNVGMGTTAPFGNLEVTNASGSGVTTIAATNYSTGFSPVFSGRKAGGTQAAPTAAQNGDSLAVLNGRGYGATGFSPAPSGAVIISARENFTDTAHGTAVSFTTTPLGSVQQSTVMTLDENGNLGLGKGHPTNAIDVLRSGQDSNVVNTSYGGQPNVFLIAGRGTHAAPAPVQIGDILGFVGLGGIDGTNAAGLAAYMGSAATENWTGTARGSALGFGTTAIGTTTQTLNLAILSNGNVGIGTPKDVNGLPTATDRLQVFGDVRVGTTGTNGCIKGFDGTGLTGMCSSDRRFKKDIVPFSPALDALTALQPVHYTWRTTEFPDRHFGTNRASGLIAQDVEKVLPELVATDTDGYKAVDYGKLPLLTLQAVKELKSENDALKSRVAELERLVNELMGTRR